MEGFFDPIPVIAGLIQTVIYTDFFYIYWTKIMQGKQFNLPVYTATRRTDTNGTGERSSVENLASSRAKRSRDARKRHGV